MDAHAHRNVVVKQLQKMSDRDLLAIPASDIDGVSRAKIGLASFKFPESRKEKMKKSSSHMLRERRGKHTSHLLKSSYAALFLLNGQGLLNYISAFCTGGCLT